MCFRTKTFDYTLDVSLSEKEIDRDSLDKVEMVQWINMGLYESMR